MPPKRIRVTADGRRISPVERGLTIRDFLALVHDGVSARLGPACEGFAHRARFGTLQYYRGAPAVHYEVWAQRRTARLEIGLHFEGARDDNYAAAALLAEHSSDVLVAVGDDYELEEWTASWTRLHRTREAPLLSPDMADDTAGRIVALMRGMEPLIEALGLRRAG
ncbi:MAG: hypothetical protein HYX50_04640 [Chloroflexi bacterium]|nr:hypothetical protein [Chloroflexota bacterium]